MTEFPKLRGLTVICAVVLASIGAISVLVARTYFGSKSAHGAAIGFVFAEINMVISLLAMRRAGAKSMLALSHAILSMFLVRMMLFMLGLALCFYMPNYGANGFGITYIVMFFAFLSFEVMFVKQWGRFYSAKFQRPNGILAATIAEGTK